jgi:hypothetical protein
MATSSDLHLKINFSNELNHFREAFYALISDELSSVLNLYDNFKVVLPNSRIFWYFIFLFRWATQQGCQIFLGTKYQYGEKYTK